MHFLGCLFLLVLAVVMIGFAFLGTIINAILSLFGLNNRVKSHTYNQSSRQSDRQSDRQSASRQQSHQQSAGRQNQKIFEKDDSEYVDFEEIN